MTAPLDVGIIGAGRVGTALARLALAAGHRVHVANRGDRATNELLLTATAPGAVASDIAGLADRTGLVVLAVPFTVALGLPLDRLDGALVVDATNHWEPTEGPLGPAPDGTSALLAAAHPDLRWAKSLNHLGYHDMEDDARPAGTVDRRAVAVASDHVVTVVADFVDRIGFEPVDAGPLGNGVLVQPGSAVFGTFHTRSTLRAALAEDARFRPHPERATARAARA
ncbi:NAD(P)-binding domain-containing protein [Curtobacterium sp. MCSS17_016]|uniref:NADPH-dependent F420 reductase n=1 Tax=Curtobacterium sp. MCSS17_016 TaxID=2175644 RepID=UPI000DAA9177|nr:NAD(P)-binding domain-containing protein [Curtobacterium sp. MCSS17_016]WIE78208.1 NAD(P)-binding domain-containing protein [Curtobacterium sp. MCSS17_016]